MKRIAFMVAALILVANISAQEFQSISLKAVKKFSGEYAWLVVLQGEHLRGDIILRGALTVKDADSPMMSFYEAKDFEEFAFTMPSSLVLQIDKEIKAGNYIWVRIGGHTLASEIETTSDDTEQKHLLISYIDLAGQDGQVLKRLGE